MTGQAPGFFERMADRAVGAEHRWRARPRTRYEPAPGRLATDDVAGDPGVAPEPPAAAGAGLPVAADGPAPLVVPQATTRRPSAPAVATPAPSPAPSPVAAPRTSVPAHPLPSAPPRATSPRASTPPPSAAPPAVPRVPASPSSREPAPAPDGSPDRTLAAAPAASGLPPRVEADDVAVRGAPPTAPVRTVAVPEPSAPRADAHPVVRDTGQPPPPDAPDTQTLLREHVLPQLRARGLLPGASPVEVDDGVRPRRAAGGAAELRADGVELERRGGDVHVHIDRVQVVRAPELRPPAPATASTAQAAAGPTRSRLELHLEHRRDGHR